MRASVLEDLEHAGACDLPNLGAELLPIQDHQVLQTVCPRPSQLLIVCRGKEETSEKGRMQRKTERDRNQKCPNNLSPTQCFDHAYILQVLGENMKFFVSVRLTFIGL